MIPCTFMEIFIGFLCMLSNEQQPGNLMYRNEV